VDFSFAKVFDLSGQVALITGGASGIGKSIAALFAERGATLVLVDRSETVHEMARSFGPNHLSAVADVADEVAALRVVSGSVEKLGRIDILVNNAGIGPLAKAEDTSAELWDTTMAVNLRGPFLYAREVGKQMIKQGRGRIILEKAVDPSESGGLMGWQSGRVGRGKHEFGERTGEDCAQSLCIGQLLRSRLQ
jgi:NAD(P)-dependent dehydrogenase (short-subunit alcohol dehydrogenase family)